MNTDKDIATIIDDLMTTDVDDRQTVYPITDALRDRTGHNPPQRAALVERDGFSVVNGEKRLVFPLPRNVLIEVGVEISINIVRNPALRT